ncbi:hypothetical protein [Winogradskyella aurantiaca]|uniref:hypothetical protein n=1 Tax=Winogradskyella aurantiaca TaxID=2219558 RepID=UPI001E2C7007|nr:hypothetical protein [Winogradskyella aurantiaca]
MGAAHIIGAHRILVYKGHSNTGVKALIHPLVKVGGDVLGDALGQAKGRTKEKNIGIDAHCVGV